LRSSIDWRTNSNGVPDSLDFSITSINADFTVDLDADIDFFINGQKVFSGEVLQKKFKHQSAKISKFFLSTVGVVSKSFRAEHTPSIFFRHVLPNSARIRYTTEGALNISAQLSTDADGALRSVWLLIRLRTQHSIEAST